MGKSKTLLRDVGGKATILGFEIHPEHHSFLALMSTSSLQTRMADACA